MKKLIALLLALVMVFALCACADSGSTVSAKEDSNATATPKPTATPEPTEKPKPKLTDSNALTLANGYISAYDFVLEKAAKAYNNAVYSISSINVASATASDAYIYSAENGYKITAKGTFWAEDDFGNYINKYNFTWKLEGDYKWETSDWLLVSWTNDSHDVSSITISK